MRDLSGGPVTGKLRLGIPDDHGKEALSKIIAEFAQDYPKVDLMVHCALSTGFPAALAAGELDLAIHEVEELRPGMELLREDKMHWVAASAHNLLERDPIPVALFDQACWWRDAALTALEASGRPYRIVYSSESVTGVAAAVEAGIAIGVLDRSALTPDLVILSESDGLGVMPSSKLVLEYGKSPNTAVCSAMAASIKRTFAAAQR